MKKMLLLLVVLVFFSCSYVNAGGVVMSSVGGVYSSILHKTFTKDKYNGESVERWILIQTNLPNFTLNAAKKQAKKQKIPFSRQYQDKYILEIHQKLLNSFHNAWYFYFLPENESFISREAINLGSNIYVYRKQPKQRRCIAKPIVDYRLDIIPDIEVNFLDTGKLSFWVTIPEVDSSSNFNRFKYRGEGLDKFFNKVVFRKYEGSLRNNYHYK